MTKKILKKWNITSESFNIIPAKKDRVWMKDSNHSFAYRCLPLTVSNGFGWWILNPFRTEIVWNGGNNIEDITIQCFDQNNNFINQHLCLTHFGEGVVTWNLGFVLQTEIGHNLYVKGPANLPKRGIVALEGLIETDWLPFTFTMNWKCTEPNFKIIFEKDEPICQFFPTERYYLESWDSIEDHISNSGEFYEKYKDWEQSRNEYLKNLSNMKPKEAIGQRDYMKGTDKDGVVFKDHQTNIKSCPFKKFFGGK
jgi:hypothetical protein